MDCSFVGSLSVYASSFLVANQYFGTTCRSHNQGANDPRVDLLLDNLYPDDGTDKLFRNVSYQPQTTLREHQEKKKPAFQFERGRSLK